MAVDGLGIAVEREDAIRGRIVQYRVRVRRRGRRRSTFSVLRSNMITLLSSPGRGEAVPRPRYASATPCAPASPGTSPSSLPDPGSTTITRVWRAMNSRWPAVSTVT